MKRESTRRTVGMKVGTSSGGSSKPLPSLSVVVVVPSSASRARAKRGKIRDSDRKREYDFVASAAVLPC
jgi:hypothetical protein